MNYKAKDEIFDALADPEMSDDERNLIFEYLIGFYVNGRCKLVESIGFLSGRRDV